MELPDLEVFAEIGRRMAASNRFVARKVIAPQVTADELDSADLADVAPLFDKFPELVAGTATTAGEVYTLDGKLIEIVQGHPSILQNWIDALDPSLFKIHHVDGAPFRPVTGAHDTYKLGQIVTFEGALWRSVIDNNAYSPTTYPAGWELV